MPTSELRSIESSPKKKRKPKSPKQTYVYKITDRTNGKFYIGYRTCLASTDPLDDLGVSYYTSGKMKDTFRNFKQFFDREIIASHKDKRDAYVLEQTIISSNFSNPLCQNRYYDPKAATRPSRGKEFNQDYINMSRSQQKKVKRQEAAKKKRIKNKKKIEGPYVTYVDLETGITVKNYSP